VTQAVRRTLASPRLAVPLVLIVAGAAFVVLLVVSESHPNKVAAGSAPRPPTVGLRATKLGRILVDSRGHTLYLFLEDARGRSTCFGGCARVWPALLASGRPRAGAGVDPAKLTARPRRHSALEQVVYAGHPLYTTVADTRPGQTEGQGFLGTWFVVARSGRLIGKPSKGGGY
jgi:predicted lipoprotein with Yx(FWY)xxD motif